MTMRHDLLKNYWDLKKQYKDIYIFKDNNQGVEWIYDVKPDYTVMIYDELAHKLVPLKQNPNSEILVRIPEEYDYIKPESFNLYI